MGDSLKEISFKNVFFKGVNHLREAGSEEITFFHNPKYREDLKTIKAGACILEEKFLKFLPKGTIPLLSKTPYRSYAQVAEAFFPPLLKGIQEEAVHPSVKIGQGTIIHKNAILERDVIIGENCVVGPHTLIKEGCVIGNKVMVDHNVTISHALIGNNVEIQPGTRIGQAGFGFHMDEKGHFSVPQLGAVIIGDNVHIGSNTTIDRGSLNDTIIENGARIDNLVQIAHNVHIGENSILVAQVGIAGSTHLGKFVIVAGQVGIAGHLKIEDHVRIAAQSGIMRDVKKGETIAGSPALPIKDWHKQTICLRKLIKR